MIRVGLIGARGYVGRELINALDGDERFDLVFASSRALAGRRLSQSPGLQGLSRFDGLVAEELDPEQAAGRPVEAIVLGLPNGVSAPFVAAIEKNQPQMLVIDLGADHRYQDGWVYGSPELNRHAISGAKRIANPGCYATAANLGLGPLTDLLSGVPSVFGLSGFSGAGTTPGSRNDPERLESNVIPYGFGGHGHEGEIEATVGVPITFAPHVGPFFRGLLTTITVPLAEYHHGADIHARFETFYRNHPTIRISVEAPEIADVAGRDGAQIGGFAVDETTHVLTFTSGLDNLLKGAATQAIENISLSFALTADRRS